jgi:small subunit ribosomal protein S2
LVAPLFRSSFRSQKCGVFYTGSGKKKPKTKENKMALPSIEEMLEAGVHFGHQTRRWNPKMRRFILAERNGIHVINLQKTQAALEESKKVLRDIATAGKSILFVGTKSTSKLVVQEVANRIGHYYVAKRWLGGMLTNFATVKQSIRRLEKIEQMEKDGTFKELTKKEVLGLNAERAKLEEVFGGIRHMKGLPSLIVVTDVKYEHLAIAEARRLRIPLIAICDTNVDPDTVDYAIPGNDDAVKSLNLLIGYLTEDLGKGETAKDETNA